MTFAGIEPVVREIITELKAHLPTELLALEDLGGNHVHLPAPVNAAYFWYVPTLFASWPAVIARPQPQSATVIAMTGQYRMSYSVQVDVITRHEDVAATDVALWRYWLAIAQILAKEDALASGSCVLHGIDWSQPIIVDQDSGDELRDVPSIVTVTTYEGAN
jgi:hypothetical protein